MTCEVCLELISRFLDEDLSSEETLAMDEHLSACETCRGIYTDTKEMVDAMHELPDPPMPEEVHGSAMNVIRGMASSHKRRRFIAWGGVAAAAVVCVLAIPSILASMPAGSALMREDNMANAMYQTNGAWEEKAYGMPSASSAPQPAPAAMMSGGEGGYMMDMAMAESDIAYNDYDGGIGALPPFEPPMGSGGTEHGIKIERSFSISIDTAAFDADFERISGLAGNAGAYFEFREVSGLSYDEPDGYGRYASMTIRVPAERLDAFVGDLRATGRVMQAYEYANDITSQYYDTQARLDSYTIQRDKLEQLLTRAESVDDVLNIQNALTDLQYKIDSLTGQIKGMDGRVSYASVSLSLREIQPKDALLPANPGLAERIKEGFFEATNALVAFLSGCLVVLVAGSPVWLPIVVLGIAAFFIVRGTVRRKRKKRAQAQ